MSESRSNKKRLFDDIEEEEKPQNVSMAEDSSDDEEEENELVCKIKNHGIAKTKYGQSLLLYAHLAENPDTPFIVVDAELNKEREPVPLFTAHPLYKEDEDDCVYPALVFNYEAIQRFKAMIVHPRTRRYYDKMIMYFREIANGEKSAIVNFHEWYFTDDCVKKIVTLLGADNWDIFNPEKEHRLFGALAALVNAGDGWIEHCCKEEESRAMFVRFFRRVARAVNRAVARNGFFAVDLNVDQSRAGLIHLLGMMTLKLFEVDISFDVDLDRLRNYES